MFCSYSQVKHHGQEEFIRIESLTLIFINVPSRHILLYLLVRDQHNALSTNDKLAMHSIVNRNKADNNGYIHLYQY